MVMLQVVQVNELFEQIEKLRKSQWQEVRNLNIIQVNSAFILCEFNVLEEVWNTLAKK